MDAMKAIVLFSVLLASHFVNGASSAGFNSRLQGSGRVLVQSDCDVRSNTPNACYNVDGSSFVCCPASCPMNPGPVAACGGNPPTGSECDITSSTPNPCYNVDGSKFTCCPASCPMNPGTVAACDGPPAPTQTSGTPASTPGSTPTSGGGVGVASIFTQDQFNQFFVRKDDPLCGHRNFYTYDSFVTAAAAFPGFGTSGSDTVNKQEIAAFMGQISHETTGGPLVWGLCFDEERQAGPQGTPIIQTAPYCDTSQYPCAPGVSYHGRGPIQLSWNYNYIPAGKAIGFDGLNNPDAVLSDPVIAWKTAIYFWMTAVGSKPSAHAVITGTWTPTPADQAANRLPGFGVVTNIVNGGLECGPDRLNTSGGPDRIDYFTRYAGILGVSTGSNLSCDSQQPFK